jgi:hypothetical protein
MPVAAARERALHWVLPSGGLVCSARGAYQERSPLGVLI